MASDLESQMVSVERVRAYAAMPQEAPHTTPQDPPASWPQKGTSLTVVVVIGLSICYMK